MLTRPLVLSASGVALLNFACFVEYARVDPTMPAACPADLIGNAFVDDTDFVAFAAACYELLCP